MRALAVVVSQPRELEVRHLALTPPGPADVVVDIEWSGISTGTERLLWSGTHAAVPRHGLSAGARLRIGRPRGAKPAPMPACAIGERVFVPGARCFGEVRGLFGGAASRAGGARRARSRRSTRTLGEQGVLLALAATAQHALAGGAPARADRRPRRARPAARAAAVRGGRRADGVGDQPGPSRWRCRLPGARSRRRRAPRLPRHLRRQRRRRPARHAGRAARAGRRDRAGRLLRATPVASPSRPPSCARRGCASPPNGSAPTSTRCRRCSRPAACRSTA